MSKGWKYYLGISLMVYSALPLLLLVALPFLGLSLAASGTFAVTFLATGEIAFVGAAALLGKEFIQAIKARVMGIFNRTSPSSVIGRGRHRCGLTLLAASFVPYYIVLVGAIFPLRIGASVLTAVMILGEILFIVSLFVLGGQFWDRLKHLFDYPGDDQAGGARVATPVTS